MYFSSLRIEDFQSHADTTLEFHPNFNVLVGDGNAGKTSICRALSFILFGTWDVSWVRTGAKACRITLSTSTGITVVREKGEKVNKYILRKPDVPEQLYESFGTQVPDEISRVLQITKASIGEKEELNLNFSSQWDKLFLLGESGSYKAKVFGKLSKAHYLDHALRELAKDKKKATSEKAVLSLQKKDVELQLERFAGLDDSLAQIDVAGKNIAEIERQTMRWFNCTAVADRMQRWKNVHSHFKQRYDELLLVELPATDTIETQHKRLQQVKQLAARMEEWKRKHTTYKSAMERFRAEQDVLAKQYAALIQENKVCPTCFGTVDESSTQRILVHL